MKGGHDDVGVAPAIAAAGAGLAALGYALFGQPTPPPPASELRGCFVAADAPRLSFDGRLLHFGQADVPPTPYHLQWAKPGTIDVVTDAPLSLQPLGSRYIYVGGEQRLIVFAHLRHMVDDKAFGVTHVADTGFLSALTTDVEDVRYDRAPPAACLR